MPAEALRAAFVENLRCAAEKTKVAGIRLLTEPINYYDIPGFYPNRSAQALEPMTDVGSDSLCLQYDIYHAQRIEGELAGAIKAHLPKIAHMQLADNPGRNEPGTGEINYRFHFGWLDSIGYPGLDRLQVQAEDHHRSRAGLARRARRAVAGGRGQSRRRPGRGRGRRRRILRAMYTRHFGLRQPPFSIAPDPRYLFMSERHREALAHLLYGVRGGGGFVVLTGEIGAGKTTVCRCFLEHIPKRCNVAYIFNPKLTVEELLKTICAEFRIPDRHQGPGVATVKDYVDALNEYLLRTHAVGQNNVLIIDEAQNLSADVLEQLRLLTNLETNERKLLQIMLIGQPELRAMLARPELRQLAQRVIARFHLEPLEEDETALYVNHRLAVGGLAREIPFDRRALRRIHRHSGGIPRRINLLCDRALLGAYAQGRSHVDRRTVDMAAKEVFPPLESESGRRLRFGGALVVGLVLAAGVAAGAAYFLTADRVPPKSGGGEPVAQATVPNAQPVTKAAAPESTTAAGEAPPTKGLPSFDLATGFDALVGAEKASWQELARVWQISLGEGDPCQAARRQQLRCYRTPTATLTLIRQLDRPGILTLRDGAQRSAYVVLGGLSNENAVLLIGGQPHTVPLAALADYWRGEFATLWRGPPESAITVVDGRLVTSPRWLALQLATVRGDTRPVGNRVDEATVKGWLHAFQLAQGLPSDGVAGPVTLMHLNRAAGVDEPHLSSE